MRALQFLADVLDRLGEEVETRLEPLDRDIEMSSRLLVRRGILLARRLQ